MKESRQNTNNGSAGKNSNETYHIFRDHHFSCGFFSSRFGSCRAEGNSRWSERLIEQVGTGRWSVTLNSQ